VWIIGLKADEWSVRLIAECAHSNWSAPRFLKPQLAISILSLSKLSHSIEICLEAGAELLFSYSVKEYQTNVTNDINEQLGGGA
jgi:hypothetical protein